MTYCLSFKSLCISLPPLISVFNPLDVCRAAIAGQNARLQERTDAQHRILSAPLWNPRVDTWMSPALQDEAVTTMGESHASMLDSDSDSSGTARRLLRFIRSGSGEGQHTPLEEDQELSDQTEYSAAVK